MTLTFEDNEPPVFVNCPQGNTITVSLFPGICQGGANWSIPVAVDNCGEVTVEQTKGPSPGSVNAVGEYLIEYTATDGSDNTAVCTFTLKIIDTEGPLIVCPGNIFVETADDGCIWASPAGSLTPLLANSNCDASIGWSVTNPGGSKITGSDDVSGYTFSIGTSTVTYTITETVSGQTWSCTFTVEVVDTTPPVINCPEYLEVTAPAGTCTATVTLQPPTVSDNCTVEPNIKTHYVINNEFGYIGEYPGSQLEVVLHHGYNIIKWFAEDESGNIASCDYGNVMVNILKPVLDAGGNQSVCETEGSYTFSGVEAENILSFEWYSMGSGTFTNVNTLTPTYQFSNDDINAGMVVIGLYGEGCNQIYEDMMFLYIWKQPTADAGPDAAICPNGDFVLTGATAANYGSLTWTTSGNGTFNNPHALNPTYTPSPTDIAAGSVILTLKANTETGSACVPAVSSMTLTFEDNEPPIFVNCPQGNEITISLFPGVCEGGANWSIPVAVDNCGEVTVEQTKGPSPGSVNAVGEYLIEYTATDGSDNTAVCTFTLKIIDTEGPLIVCPGNLFVEATNDVCTWVSPAGSLTPLLANSNCDATVSYDITGATTIANGSDDASGVTFNLGTSIVTYTITDDNNPAQTWSCSFTVTVVDEEAPVITCPAYIEEVVEVGTCSATINLTLPDVSDNCTTAPTITYKIYYSDDHFNGVGPFPSTQLEQTFPYGWSTIEWMVKDASGNIATCYQSVHITAPAPVVYAGGNKLVCETEGSYTFSGAKAENVLSYEWFSFGSGTFTSGQGTLTPTYQFSNEDINAGMVIIGLYGEGCDHGEDDMMILYIWKQPTANAGPDTSICPNEDFVLTGATATNYGSLTWETSGNGTFNNPHALNPTYTPSPTDISAGSVKLTLTADIESGSTCVPAVSSMILTIHPEVTITIDEIVHTQCNASVGSVELTSSDGSDITLIGIDTLSSPAIFENLSAGYYIARTSGNCPAELGFNINNINSTLAATLDVSDPLCYGGTVIATITAIGGTSPYSYQLNGDASQTSGVFTNLEAGNYNVLVTDANGCTYFIAFDVDQPTQLILSLTSQTNIGCSGANTGSAIVLASGGTTPYSYAITSGPSGHSASITGNVITNMIAGTYRITVTDHNGCTDYLDVKIKEITDGDLLLLCPPDLTVHAEPGSDTWVSTPGSLTPIMQHSSCPADLSYEIQQPGHTIIPNVNVAGWNFEDASKRVAPHLPYTADTGTDDNKDISEISLIGGSTFSAWDQGSGGSGTFAPNSVNWNDGSGVKYWQIVINTEGFENLRLSSRQRSSNTGPRDFKVQYSLDGTIWADVLGANNITVANNFTTGVLNNVSLPVACENQSTLYLRWIMTSNICVRAGTGSNPTNDPVQSGGTSRIDDIVILGDEIIPVVISGNGDVSGQSFPIGTSTVTYTLTETGSGRYVECSFNVTVLTDTEPPVFVNCPSGDTLTVALFPGICEGGAIWSKPVAVDNWGPVTVTQIEGPAPGTATMTVGLYKITYRAEDAYGNTSDCSFYINVIDTEGPVIVCPNNLTVSAGSDCEWESPAGSLTPLLANSDCPVVITYDILLPDHIVNNDKIAEWNFEDPLKRVAPHLPYTADDGNSLNIDLSEITLVGASLKLTSSRPEDNPPWFQGAGGPGTYAVNADYWDNGAGIKYWHIEVNTLGYENLKLSSKQRSSSTGPRDFKVQYSLNNLNWFDVPGSNITATEDLDNWTGVLDNILLPSICENKPTVYLRWIMTSNICERAGTGSYPPDEAVQTGGTNRIDDIVILGDNKFIYGENDASGETFPIGTSTVTYTITETASGQTWSCSFTVTVVDEEAPVIDTCPSAISQNTDTGECTSTIALILPDVSDNCTATPIISYRVFNPDHSLSPWYGSASNTYTFSLGISQVEWKVEDEYGNTTTCLQEVEIIDDELPQIVCASESPFTRTTTEGVCGYLVNGDEFDATVSDNCSLVSLSHDYAPYHPATLAGATFPVGTTTVTWTAVDASGNTSECQISITIADNEAPVFVNCPDGQTFTVGLFDGICEGGAIWSIPIAEDNCSVTVTQVEGPAPGTATMTVGIYTISYRAEDASGNAATCTFYIKVVDTDEPLIVCPGNVVVSTTDLGTCEWTSPSGSLTPLLASSNCPATVSYVITGATTASGLDDASGETFQIGTSTVTYTITETVSGQSWGCSFTVTVVDEEAPVIDICPEAISQNTDTGECAATIALILPDVSDNCTATPIISYRVFNPDHSLSPWYGSASNTYTFSLGISQVEWKVEDEFGNTTFCLQEVHITDSELPQIVCASEIPFTRTTTEGVCGYIVDGSEFDATASDNCSLVSLSHDYAPYNPATLAGATFPVGTTTVTWTAVDASGNTSECQISITIADNEAPVFVNCPDGQTFTVGLFDGICEGGAIWSIPIAEDNCSVTVTQVEGPAPGTATMTVGIYTISYRAEDASGNAATCTFYIKVVDTDEPLIVCPGNVVVSTTDLGTCEWTSPSGSLTPLLASSNCPATVSYVITGATTASGLDDASGETFQIGTSTVTYTITETVSGQSWGCSFTVTVVDEEAPVIDICPEAISQNTDTGECAATIALILPDVSDNCTATPIISYRVFNPDHSLSPWYGSASNTYTFSLGISQVEWKVEDEYGNTTTCLQEVEIIDDELPQIVCASESPFTRTTTEGVCGYLVNGDEFDATASDNCSIVSLSHDYAPYNPATLAGATFPVGTTIVTWTAVDASGNTSECQISITVTDNEAPVFVNCPDGEIFTVGLFDGICEGGAIWSIPIAEDNCSVTVTQVEGPAPGTATMTVGIYTISYRAEDASGNAATCTFYIKVVDTDEPLIVCPGNVVVSTTDLGTCEWTSPSGSLTPLLASSNCPATVSYVITGATTASGLDDASGETFQIGTSTVTYTITETVSGQSWGCSFTVTVVDEEAPVIDICPEAISQNTDTGECAATIALILPDVSDNCTATPIISYRVFNPDHSLSPWYGSASNTYTFSLGISQVEWKVEDEFGNTTFCLQEVEILEVPVTVDAGSDMGICAGQSYQLNGSVTNALTFEWSTSGTGSFDNPNALNPVYTPSYGDILDIQVTLTLTAIGSCSTVSDQMVLTIFPPPVANAGIDAVICSDDSYQIVTASADHYTGLSWTHNGLGTLLGSNTLTPVYQSASGETGIVTLELTVEGYGTCGSVTDVMTITIAPSPEADAGINTDLCGESYALLTGNFVPDAIVEWSQVGGPNQAFLFNSNTNNALAFGIINGTYIFSYTVTLGSCVSTDEVVITNWQPPVCCISAGSDLIICDDDEVTLTGTLPLVGDILWTQVNGPSTAVIQTPDNYQTLVTGLEPGVYTFKYANFNGPACDTICDFVSVTVYEPPVAFAGVDTVICQNYSYAVNDATASGYHTLEWSTSGTGSFSDVTVLNPVYIPSQTDIINGSVQLKLKAYGSVHCPIAISTMILTIQAPADIQAVDDVGTPVNGYTGGIAVLNVLTNDLLNGQAVVDFTNVTLTVIEPASSTGVNLDVNTGQVTVDIATTPGIYTIKYRICENLCPDNCSDAIVTITVLVPVPPDSTVVECLSHAIPPVAPEVVDVVCGGLVTSTYVFIDDPDPLVCEGSRVYIFTYEDCAQNKFTWTYTYNVERSTPPVIAAGSAVPTSSVVECYSSVVPPELPVVIDVCGNVLNPVESSPVISGTYDGCEGTVVYTYTYKDCADLPFVWTYTYTIEHSTGPVISKPATVSSIVECYAEITEPELPTVIDVCDNVLSPTDSSPEVVSNYDDCEGTVTYTYTFKDCAGLELVWNYTYIIDLQTAPVVPANGEAIVNCFADASEPILPEVYDHCGNMLTAELISVIDDPDMYACEGSRVYTYKFTDCAGNSSDWQFTYYIELTTSPEVPANGHATVNCISDAVPPQIPEITDDCGNVLTPELVEIVTEPQDIVCSGIRTYKYEFQDCAGNISYWMFTYTISRYTPPHVQIPAPNKATVACLEDAVWPTQMPVVVDACGNVLDYTPPVNITTMGYNNGVMCNGGYKRYTFKYKDPCDPSIEMSWVFMYTVLPQTGPELIDQLAGCNTLNQDGIQISLADAQLFNPASLEASVAALYIASCGDVDANLINTTYTGNDLSWTGIYTYKIFDRCDNFQICQIMYSGGFVGGPTLIDPLEDCSSLSQQNINQCFAYVEAFDATTLESDVASLYTYFGEPVTASLVDSDISGDDCNWLAIYTFDIKGEVGESVSCQVFYTGGDTEAPVLVGTLSQGATGMNLCFTDIPAGPGADEIKALFTDNCGEVTVVKSGTPTGDNCNWSVTYLYNITDECGNAADPIIITYSGSNQTPPIVPEAVNVTVNCKSQVIEPVVLPVVTAACGDTLTYSLSVQEIPPAFTCEGNIIYTYRFTDECGLYSDWTYTYTVERTTPPHQVGGPVPATKTVACLEDAVWPEQLPVVVDACGNILDYTPPVNITTMGYSHGVMCNGGYKRYTFKYKDPCNPAIEMSWVFRYEILPTTAPVLKDELVSCSNLDQTGLTWSLGYAEQFDPAVLEGDVAALYKDVCGDDITATHIRTEKDHQSELGIVTVWNFYYTFRIENSCGNYVECEVHYNGSEVPTALTLEDITVEIDDVMCFGASEVLTVSDVVVKAGGDLTLIAGQSVKLLPGFRVEEGGYLHAYISDTYCANPTPLVVAKDSESTLPEVISEIPEGHSFFRVYPNPTLSTFTLDMYDYESEIIVEIYNMVGSKIMSKEVSGFSKYVFDLSKQHGGIYIIRVLKGNETAVERIIKQ